MKVVRRVEGMIYFWEERVEKSSALMLKIPGPWKAPLVPPKMRATIELLD